MGSLNSDSNNFVWIAFELFLIIKSEEQKGGIIVTDNLKKVLAKFEKNWRQSYETQMEEFRKQASEERSNQISEALDKQRELAWAKYEAEYEAQFTQEESSSPEE